MTCTRVFVYKNLNKGCWSVKALNGDARGRVVAHANSVLLRDCEFSVSEAGRQRVLREGRKNVHAGVKGNIVALSGSLTATGKGLANIPEPHITSQDLWHLITYNPYKMARFMNKSTGGDVVRSSACFFGDGKVLVKEPLDSVGVTKS